jgi:hypothetical protein
MGNTFFDASASAFVMPDLQASHHIPLNPFDPQQDEGEAAVGRNGWCGHRQRQEGGEGWRGEASVDDETVCRQLGALSACARGGALGPEWVSKTGLVDQMLPAQVTSRQGTLQVGQEPVEMLMSCATI